MIERFRQHFESTFPDLSDKKLLLAFSGGIDSVVLLHLLQAIGYAPALAHGNFGLRGAESDGDQAFVESLARKYGLDVHVMSWDTTSYAEDHGLSIQQAARDLRYRWFDELCKANGYGALLTAHHADDNLETFLINMTRGCGLDGLQGIPVRNGLVVRPLLPFSRAEIVGYARNHQLTWREDSSNESDDYVRNKIRLKVLPVLKEINPSVLSSFASTLDHLHQSQSMVRDASALVAKQVMVVKDDKTIIKLNELLQLPDYRGYLYVWLKDLGFSAWDDIYRLPHASSGKKVFSDEYMLLKDREVLILSRIPEADDRKYLVDSSGANASQVMLMIEKVNGVDNASNDCIFVDADLLRFPLSLRKWRQGDVFYPFGMTGKKLVSKYFKDEKLSEFDKATVWLLCSGADVVWVVGHRADNRFRVTSETKQVLKISAS